MIGAWEEAELVLRQELDDDDAVSALQALQAHGFTLIGTAPDAMAYLPARALAALSNALGLMVRHSIDDKDTIGELAGAATGADERLTLIEAQLNDLAGTLESRLDAVRDDIGSACAGPDDRIVELEKRPATRARKAA